MLKLRVFRSGDSAIKVWLCDQQGEPLRQLQRYVGHPGGSVDWERAVESCELLPGGEGFEITLVPGD